VRVIAVGQDRSTAPAELVTQFQTLSVDELQSLSLFVLDAASIDQVAARVRQLRN